MRRYFYRNAPGTDGRRILGTRPSEEACTVPFMELGQRTPDFSFLLKNRVKNFFHCPAE
jgi:hypothetical protein